MRILKRCWATIEKYIDILGIICAMAMFLEGMAALSDKRYSEAQAYFLAAIYFRLMFMETNKTEITINGDTTITGPK